MSKASKDPMEVPLSPDRVSYSIGTLLGADDFLDEQSYHRGRLARALSALHGGGTLAGLKVEWVKAAAGQEEELRLNPGLAIDRLGRLIEVPRRWCLRLQKWYDDQPEAQLRAAHNAAAGAVICDLFLQFENCERGRTPSFASTAFDGLSATSASRYRDGFRLDLLPRTTPLSPNPQWPGLGPGATPDQVKDAILDVKFGADFDGRNWTELDEHKAGVDPLAVLLARVPIPADVPGAAGKPARRAQDVKPDNRVRRFAWPPSILARLTGL